MNLISKILLALFLLLATESTAKEKKIIIKNTPVNFGDYNYRNPNPTDAVGAIDVTLENIDDDQAKKSDGEDGDDDDGHTLVIKLDAGENSDGIGDFSPRRMRAGNDDTVDYNLYIDAACSKIWGDGTNKTHTRYGEGHFTVYGRIGAGQRRKPGYYNDTVMVTVEW